MLLLWFGLFYFFFLLPQKMLHYEGSILKTVKVTHMYVHTYIHAYIHVCADIHELMTYENSRVSSAFELAENVENLAAKKNSGW